MRITYFSNYKDTCVNLFEDISWHDICNQFKTHEIQNNKDGRMFNLCTFDRLTDLDAPYDENRTDKRCFENVIGYDGLILDYDGNGAKIEKIIPRFVEFTHLGYTSYRHILNDEGCEKFRIVLPFQDICPTNEWEIRKEAFLEFAGPEIDRSCVSHSRSFYAPACPPEGIPYKDTWSNNGIILDWRWFTPAVKPVVTPRVYKPLAVTDLQKALDELKKHRPILPNEDRYWLVRAVTRSVGEAQAIIECRSRWPDATYNGKYETMVKKITPKTPDVGRIINEIRKFNPLYRANSSSWKEDREQIYQKYVMK